ncbi:SfnB family sulfur acquisition oxidoreductase [Acidisoma cellulosilytica]|uniref:SfnB family sulfur acquisition oxidoreductase n=1 Tax=Acidisoma cellulosilyticum TaxID=2802395 RepID=A0A964E5A6_9PROT|nr:SfnB family sulfur acquisition oxidoreductase [Acidisoma cellulosilyticum]MCB8882212.1 SfnB family sulfur acquisition oxidoreductase [Acidisoma cellulosilyticum]
MSSALRTDDNHEAAVSRPVAPIIRDDAEAIQVARALAPDLAAGAIERDQKRILPRAELDLFSSSGLWGITVPRAYGGADVSFATLAEVIATISAADPSIGQIPQNHFGVVEALRVTANEEQKRRFYRGVLEGRRFGNAFSESGSKHAGIFDTKLVRDGEIYRVTGQKFYATGALFADIIPIAATAEDGNAYLVFADPKAPGLTVTDNWSGFGQRTTASGAVTLDHVAIAARDVVPAYLGYDQPSANGPVSQIIQAAVDLGIARAAIADTIDFVRTRSRPWVDSGRETAAEDPYTIAAVGDLVIRLHAAEAILALAGTSVDAAIAEATEQTVAAASLKVAEAKVLTTEIALLAGNKLHELAGTRSTLQQHGLDRHWRNARTHTLHDPVRWKFALIGNHTLNGVLPPRHPWN